jgi:hypothetical protein
MFELINDPMLRGRGVRVRGGEGIGNWRGAGSAGLEGEGSEAGLRQMGGGGVMIVGVAAVGRLAAVGAPWQEQTVDPFCGCRSGDDMKSGRSKSLLILALSVLAGGGAIAVYFGVVREATYEEVRAQTAPLIDAIDRYAKDNHAFPSVLSDLVPKYLPAVPRPPRGASTWGYYNNHNSNFNLEIKTSSARIWYSGRTGWSIGDADF